MRRRGHPRVSTDASIHAYLLARELPRTSVQLVNLSVSGLRFLAPCVTGKPAANFSLHLTLPKSAGVTLPCVVRYASGEPCTTWPPSCYYGVEFHDVDEDAKGLLRRFIDTRLGPRPI